MLGNRVPVIRLLLLLIALPLVVACPPKPPQEPTEPPQVEPASPSTREPAPAPDKDVQDVTEPKWGEAGEPSEEGLSPLEKEAQELTEQGVLQTIYFPTDKSDLTPEARSILATNASWLRNNTQFGVIVQGHCDDRNTEEYNLALGERRADAVRSYLISLGIDSSRIETISYGEERPVALGNDESAWSQNRRAQFVLKAG